METSLKQTQAIIDHAMKHFSVPENEISVCQITIPELPSNLEAYYVETKGSYGNDYCNYIISDDEMFSNAEKNSLERLLKKESYQERKHLDVDQVIMLFRLLKRPMKDSEVIKADDLAKGGLQERYAGKIGAPSLKESKDEVDIVFWTIGLRQRVPEKWMVHISSDYRVESKSESLTA